jgi:hypothetical protein
MALQTGVVHASGVTPRRAILIAVMLICAFLCSHPRSLTMSTSLQVSIEAVYTSRHRHVAKFPRATQVAQPAQKQADALFASR